MSTLTKRSKFYYGHLMTGDNKYFDFVEGVTAFVAILPLGDMTLNEFVSNLATQMTLVGGQTYTAVLDRATRKITISAPGNFEIRIDGDHAGTSGWALAGFTANRTGSNSYQGNVGSGFVYECQYKLFKFVSLDDTKVLESSAVNISAQGNVQVISFGDGSRMEAEIRIITDLELEQTGFLYNPTGLADARSFLNYLKYKSKVEFMADVDDSDSFVEVLLDGSVYDKDGTGWQLKNIAPDIYTTGLLKFRGVIR